jgi:hypothetical protein
VNWAVPRGSTPVVESRQDNEIKSGRRPDVSNSDLPGTGGDYKPRVDDTDEDVEGHRQGNDGTDTPESGEGARRVDGSESARRVDGTDEDDVEGHLYRLGPTTEGEFARRGPGENPHGDR